jgi:hypothetical protein
VSLRCRSQSSYLPLSRASRTRMYLACVALGLFSITYRRTDTARNKGVSSDLLLDHWSARRCTTT